MKERNQVIRSLGDAPFDRKDMIRDLSEFALLYEQRPIALNEGGMASPHLFATWFMLRHLRPKCVIESGVWRGQGTWAIAQACPEARIYCLDPCLDQLVYRWPAAVYSTQDFSRHAWEVLAEDRTVAFFDDHQDAVERIRLGAKLGIKRFIFEDNYPLGRGDFST